MKRWPVLILVLAIVGAAFGLYLGRTPRVQVIRGVVGSEKLPLLTDPRVTAVFARHRLRLSLDARGSREMAATVPLHRYDFAFPSSEPTAERLRRTRPATGVYTPFSSVLAVATFTPIVDLLAGQRLVRRTPEGLWVLDVRALLDLAQREMRWDQLPGNVVYPARRDILLTSTHPGDSSSAATYAWLAATVLAPGPPDDTLLNRLAELFADQGAMERSTEDPFEKYLAQGLNYAPLVLGYEAQYLDAARARLLPQNAVLVQLGPTARTAHPVVAFTAAGDRVGRLLTTDPELVRLAAEHGFRVTDEPVFSAALAGLPPGVTPPVRLTDVIAPPDPAAWDALQAGLDQRLRP